MAGAAKAKRDCRSLAAPTIARRLRSHGRSGLRPTRRVARCPRPLAAFLDASRAAIDAVRSARSCCPSRVMPAAGRASVRVRLIALKGAPALSFVATHATRDVTRNLGVDDGIAEIAASPRRDHAPAFAHATLHAAGGDAQLLVSKKGKATLRRHGARAPMPTAAGAAEPAAPTSSRRTTARARAACRSTCRSWPSSASPTRATGWCRRWRASGARSTSSSRSSTTRSMRCRPRRAATAPRRCASSTTAAARAT